MSTRCCFILGFLLLLSPLALIRFQGQGKTTKVHYHGTFVHYVSYTEPWKVATNETDDFWAIGAVYLHTYRRGEIVRSDCYFIPQSGADCNFEVGDEVETIHFVGYEYAAKLKKIWVKK